MKSFRFYPSNSVIPPSRLASDCSEDEKKRFQQEFAPVAEQSRRMRLLVLFPILGFMGCILSGFFMRGLPAWLWVPVILCWLIGMGIMFTAPALTCPACLNRIEQTFARFCPDCGSDGVKPGDWCSPAQCPTCGKTFRRGRHGFSYRLRHCTHCGLMLDEKGL